MNRATTSEFRDEPSDDPHIHRRWYADSPVSSTVVTASVRVLELSLNVAKEDGYAIPFLRVDLEVKADGDTSDQPDCWSVTYFHFADVIMHEIEAYLRRYCPAPDEVLDTLLSRSYVWK